MPSSLNTFNRNYGLLSKNHMASILIHQKHPFIIQYIHSTPPKIITAHSHSHQTWHFMTLPRIKVPPLKPKPSWGLAESLLSHLIPSHETYQFLFNVSYKILKSSSVARNKMTFTRTIKHHNYTFDPLGKQTLANSQLGLPGDSNDILIKSPHILNAKEHHTTSSHFRIDSFLL